MGGVDFTDILMRWDFKVCQEGSGGGRDGSLSH